MVVELSWSALHCEQFLLTSIYLGIAPQDIDPLKPYGTALERIASPETPQIGLGFHSSMSPIRGIHEGAFNL